MRFTGTSARVLIAAAVAAASLAAVSPAAAQTQPDAAATSAASAVLPPQASADCAGNVPVVVASDAGAQADLYSAVTLAAVVGTDCVVLAGARGEPMPEAQRRRLSAASAGGWVVGGATAVPAAKVAGFALERLAGRDRWHTARLVGDFARRHAAGSTSTASASFGASARAHDPSAPCSGDLPIVVASDAAAEPDRYSAVTLAAVVGTDCVVLAGARGEPMPEAQRRRLSAASAGGWVVGGATAVPAAKVAGFALERLAGRDRWHTARLVGDFARRHAAGGTAVVQGGNAEGHGLACALRDDRRVRCVWLEGGTAPVGVDPPSGAYVRLVQSPQAACGLRTDGTAVCWSVQHQRVGARLVPQAEVLEVPGGSYGSLAMDYPVACGVRTDTTLACWSFDSDGNVASPAAERATDAALTGGAYGGVQVAQRTACALGIDGTADCWVFRTRLDADGSLRTTAAAASTPAGTFASIEMSTSRRLPYAVACGLRTDRTVTCWTFADTAADAGATAAAVPIQTPGGRYAGIDAGPDAACGRRAGGTAVCWAYAADWKIDGTFTAHAAAIDTPSGAFAGLVLGRDAACGLRADYSVACWLWGIGPTADGFETVTAMVPGIAPHTYTGVDLSYDTVCALRTDRRLRCWPLDGRRVSSAEQPGRRDEFVAFDVGVGYGCGLRTDGTVACWGSHGVTGFGGSRTDRPSGSYAAVAVGRSSVCALGTGGGLSCWGWYAHR